MKVKPNFFIIGESKAGTTSLWMYLFQHPSVFMSSVKEPHYFSSDLRSSSGHLYSYERYLQLFSGSESFSVRGEASGTYLTYADIVAERIREFNPSSKILVSVRNREDKVFSAYSHAVRDLSQDRPFLDVWRDYAGQAIISEKIKKYLDVFGADRVGILDFEELKNKLNDTMENLYKFLEVEKNDISTYDTFNKSGRPKMRWLQNAIQSSNPVKLKAASFLPSPVKNRIKYKIMDLNTTSIEFPERARDEMREYFRAEKRELDRLLDKYGIKNFVSS